MTDATGTAMQLRLLDTTAQLRVDPDAVAGVARLLAPFRVGEHSEPAVIRLSLTHDRDSDLFRAYRDDELLAGANNWAVPFGAAMTALNRQAIDDYTGLALHAGVVAVDGVAIAFPADSGGGKSTLTAACVRDGFEYVSDESLCIDPASAAVVLYPKPLGLSYWSRTQVGLDDSALAFPPGRGEGMATAEDLGSRVATGEIRLAHVVLPVYGSNPAQLAAEPAQTALAALLEHSFNHYKLGERAFMLAAQLANEVQAWTLEYEDPVAAAQLIRSLVS
ncbi:MAG: hypothetical protein HKN91_09780 [Acidimicrobiia bacterium]|nr:hypothetical protein [Acidimicrobiia bacterium]